MNEGLRIYNLFPTLAGTIRDWTMHLPRIAGMGFNAVYINPFHYPGFSGSLYAVKDYYRLNPRFRGGEAADDDALLAGFTVAAHAHGLRIIMDLVVNHTSAMASWSLLMPSIPPTPGARLSGAILQSSITKHRSKIRSSSIFKSWCATISVSASMVSVVMSPTRCRRRSGAV